VSNSFIYSSFITSDPFSWFICFLNLSPMLDSRRRTTQILTAMKHVSVVCTVISLSYYNTLQLVLSR